METEREKKQDFPAVSFDEFQVPTYDEWHAAAEAALKGAPFDKRMYTKTYEGIRLSPIYRLEDVEQLPWKDTYPGVSPYLRGCSAGGYMTDPWLIAQPSKFVLPAEANRVMKRELARGSGCVHFELDECTRKGLDPQKDIYRGDYRGLSVATVADVKTAFEGLDLTKTPLHIYAGASAAPLLALLAAAGEAKQLKNYRGCVGADPLGALAEDGSVPLPLDELCDEMALSIAWAAGKMPQVKTILVRGEPYANGGASAVQESACAVAAAVYYVRAMQRRGLALTEILKNIRFSFSLGANFFMEIARLRAVRMVWAQVAESFGAKPEDARMDIMARTSRFTESSCDPYVNVLRTTTETFSGVVGGVNSMEVGCFDDAVRPADEHSRRIARNIQIMMQTEFDFQSPVDPAGGSWYVEKLTEQVAEEVWKLLQKIEGEGGLAASLEKGTVQDEISAVLESRFRNLAFRSDRAVGTNMYANMVEKPLSNDEFVAADKLFADRNAAVKAAAAAADGKKKAAALAAIAPSLEKNNEEFTDNIAAAFAAGATLGEVRKTLDDDFAGSVTVKRIEPHRWTERFEALRKRTEDFTARTGKNIRVFLANMGPIPQHKARADFSTGFMEVAHFEVLKNDGFKTAEEAVEAAKEAQADVAVICSKDDVYPELVPPLARGLKAACPGMKVMLAGAPAPECKDSYVEAGVDDFIHVRANCYEILKAIQDAKEGC